MSNSSEYNLKGAYTCRIRGLKLIARRILPNLVTRRIELARISQAFILKPRLCHNSPSYQLKTLKFGRYKSPCGYVRLNSAYYQLKKPKFGNNMLCNQHYLSYLAVFSLKLLGVVNPTFDSIGKSFRVASSFVQIKKKEIIYLFWFIIISSWV